MRLLAFYLAAVALGVAVSGCDSYPSSCDEGDLGIEDLRVGTGDDVATINDSVRVDYNGALENGDVFARQTDERVFLPDARPLGFRDGVVGMRENGLRRITVPPNFGFGPSGFPDFDIPPCETLTFDVTLREVIQEDP